MKFALISSFRCVYVRFIGCSIEWKEWFPKNSKKHFGIVLLKTNSKGDTNPLIFFLLIYFMVSKSIEANICKWSPIPVQMLYKLSELVFFLSSSCKCVRVVLWGFFFVTVPYCSVQRMYTNSIQLPIFWFKSHFVLHFIFRHKCSGVDDDDDDDVNSLSEVRINYVDNLFSQNVFCICFVTSLSSCCCYCVYFFSLFFVHLFPLFSSFVFFCTINTLLCVMWNEMIHESWQPPRFAVPLGFVIWF